MYELQKKMESYLRVNLLGPGPRLMKKEFTGPLSHKVWETLTYTNPCTRWRYREESTRFILWSTFGLLTRILLTWRIWRIPNNIRKWQMGFNSAFNGVNYVTYGWNFSSFWTSSWGTLSSFPMINPMTNTQWSCPYFNCRSGLTGICCRKVTSCYEF